MDFININRTKEARNLILILILYKYLSNEYYKFNIVVLNLTDVVLLLEYLSLIHIYIYNFI